MSTTKKRFNFYLDGQDYEFVRRKALANDRSISSYLRTLIKKAIAEQEKLNEIIKAADNIKKL